MPRKPKKKKPGEEQQGRLIDLKGVAREERAAFLRQRHEALRRRLAKMGPKERTAFLREMGVEPAKRRKRRRKQEAEGFQPGKRVGIAPETQSLIDAPFDRAMAAETSRKVAAMQIRYDKFMANLIRDHQEHIGRRKIATEEPGDYKGRISKQIKGKVEESRQE